MFQYDENSDDNYFNYEYNYPSSLMHDYNDKFNDNFLYKEEIYGVNLMTMKENDDIFKEEDAMNIEEENYLKPKCKTEINSVFPTGASEPRNKEEEMKYLGKKMEIEIEKKDEIKDKDEKEEDVKSGNKNDNIKVIKGDIFEIYKEFKKGNFGRKKKSNAVNKGKHDKFSKDNIVRKIKSNLFNSILRFVNSSTIEVEIENPKKNSKKKLYYKPFFLKFEQEIITNINTEFNLNLLKMRLKDIFSNNTSKKVEKNFGTDKNKKLVEKIYEENIQKRTIEILNMTLYQCMEHFRGSKYYQELSGFEKEYKDVIDELEKKEKNDDEDNGEEYIKEFKNLLNTFKEYYENKNTRKSRKKRDN